MSCFLFLPNDGKGRRQGYRFGPAANKTNLELAHPGLIPGWLKKARFSLPQRDGLSRPNLRPTRNHKVFPVSRPGERAEPRGFDFFADTFENRRT